MNESYNQQNPDPDFINHAPPSPSQPPREQVRVPIRLPTVQPIFTYLILGIIGLVFVYSQALATGTLVPRGEDISSAELCACEVCQLSPRDQFVCDWAKDNQQVYDGEFYRLLTAMFLHADLMHIFFNGLALYIFGREVESLFGHTRFLIVYFLGGLTGSVGSLLYTDGVSIGASGAVFAVFGAMGVYLYQQQHLYGEVARKQLFQMVTLAGFNIFLGLVIPNIDNAAHIGGLAGGIFLAWFIAPEFEVQRDDDYLQPAVRVVDTNTPNKWIVIPILFAGGIVASVLYAASVLG